MYVCRNILNITSLYYVFVLLTITSLSPYKFPSPLAHSQLHKQCLDQGAPLLTFMLGMAMRVLVDSLVRISSSPTLTSGVCVCLPHQSFSSFTCSPSLLGRQKQPTSTNFEIRLFDKNRALKSLARMLTAKKIQVPIGETACDQTDTAGKWLFVVPCPFWQHNGIHYCSNCPVLH